MVRPDQLVKARNPLLPAAIIAIQRAAQRARRDAMLTHTAIVIARVGRLVRIEAYQLREQAAGDDTTDKQQDHEGAAGVGNWR